MSDNAMRRLTLEHYVGLSGGLHLVGSLCDGVEAYDFLNEGCEVDLVIINLGNWGMCQRELQQAVVASSPRWLLIEQMGNVPAFSCEPISGRLPQPLCLSKFGQLVGEVLEEQRLAA